MNDRDTAIREAQLRQDCSFKVLQDDKQSAEIAASIKKIEALLMAVITAEVDESGKAVYSNPDKRAAELAARSENQSALKGLRRQLGEVQEMASAGKIDAEYHRDLVRIYCAFAEAENGAVTP
jgi:hypothetical protein